MGLNAIHTNFKHLLALAVSFLLTFNISAQSVSKCQEVTIPLVPNTNIGKEVPNTIVKSYEDYIITGHTDLNSEGRYYPVIHIRDRQGNIHLSNMVEILKERIDEVGDGGSYLMDMSEVTASETIFLLGFTAIDNSSGDAPSCIPFLAEIDLFSGSIVQYSILDREKSIIPYRMEVNEDNDQVVVVGELFENWSFNPIGLSVAPSLPQGQGIIINVARGSIESLNWSKIGSLSINSGANSNIGSKFGNVNSTANGYMVVGEMSVSNPPLSIYPYSTRLECVHIDFNGNIIWQKSLKLSNDKARGVSSYYSAIHEKIYVLFQDYYSHSYGLVAMDLISGIHGPVTLNFPPGETNTSDLIVPKNDPYELLAVGGLLSNQDPASSSIYVPFYYGYLYNPTTQVFEQTSAHGIWGVIAYNGMEYGSNKLSPYFGSTNHSFGMFARDNSEVPDIPYTWKNSTFLFTVKDRTMSDLLLKKMNYHTNCGTGCATRLMLQTSSVTIPDSPTIQLNNINLDLTNLYIEPAHIDLDPQLTCGEYDDYYYSPRPYYEQTNSVKDIALNKIDEKSEIRVIDILGKEIFRGNYADFHQNKRRYISNLDAQILIIFEPKTGKAQKISISSN